MAEQTDDDSLGKEPSRQRRAAPPAPAELAVDFPQLEIVELIGEGGMGCVYRARHRQLGRSVALKILAPGTEDDARFAERFLREARALAKLDHPGIVRVYDFGRAGTRWFLQMELVEGTNLRSLLRDGRLPPSDALAIVPQLCDALQYAHAAGVVHRDIKPENVLIEASGRVKLADFGLAKLLDVELDARSTTDAVMGTLNYMAPEQISNPRDVDHRADIYSLGVVFYEMLTGELPLGRFEPPSKRVRVDVHVDEVVLKSLERAPERRYQHASEVRTDLERPRVAAETSRVATARRRSDVLAVAAWLFGSVVLWSVYWMVGFRLGVGAILFHGIAQAALAFTVLRGHIVETGANRLVARIAIFAVAIVCGCGAWALKSVAAWDQTSSLHFAPDRFAASAEFAQAQTRRIAEVAFSPAHVDVQQGSGSRIDSNVELNDKGWFLVASIGWMLAGAALLTGPGKSSWRAIVLSSCAGFGVQVISATLVSYGYRVFAPDEKRGVPLEGSCVSRASLLGAEAAVRAWVEADGRAIALESEWAVHVEHDSSDGTRARLLVADELSRFDRWRFDPLRGPRPRDLPKTDFVIVHIHTTGDTTVVWRSMHVQDRERELALELALTRLRSQLTE